METKKNFFLFLLALLFIISSVSFASVGKDRTPMGTISSINNVASVGKDTTAVGTISSIVSGVTIITHGWQFGGNSTSEVPLWVKTMATVIIARTGKGFVNK